MNTTNGKKERVTRFYRMLGNKRVALEKAGPGDIVAATGLSETYTGNTLCDPDEPIALESIWFPKPDVVALATGIYAEKAFDRMPILADALQDAGCENEAILNHCRQPGQHVRGCWVVDLLLGKS